MTDALDLNAKSTMRLDPLSDYLIVLVHKEEAAQGLILPDTVEVKVPMVATVQLSGPGYWTPGGTFVPNSVKPGDVVLLQFGAGTEVRLGDHVYRIVPERDLFGVFRQEGTLPVPAGPVS